MLESSINYRSIHSKDIQKIKKIILNSLEEYGANKEGFAAKDPELEDLYAFYSKVNGQYFVAEDKNILAGGAGIAPFMKEDNSIWELQKMYLAPEYRGKGIGKKLMELCISTAKNLGIQKLYIETLDSMVEANKMYQKFGFKEIEKPLGNTGHFGCDKYYLLKL